MIKALYQRESRTAIARAFDQVPHHIPALDRLEHGGLAWLNDVKDPDVAAILFKIGPAALGHDRTRSIENRHGIAKLRAVLEDAEEAGEIVMGDAQLLAAFVNAIVSGATLHHLKTERDVGSQLAEAIGGLVARQTA